MACYARLPVGAAAGCWAGRGCAAASARYGWRGFDPGRCSWRGAELGAAPDVAMPGPRSGFHPRTASKRCFVAVRSRCRNGGVQAPINVISTPTCGVLIRILVCARGMSRKEAFALLFVTGLLLGEVGKRKDRFGGEQGWGIAAPRSRARDRGAAKPPTAPVCVTGRAPFRWWCAVRR